jgi:putative membrane protein
MWYGDGWMLGMHFFWWIFWVLLIAVLVAILLRQQPGSSPATREPTALEILERRYATGEISTEEFEERKARLLGRKTGSLAQQP